MKQSRTRGQSLLRKMIGMLLCATVLSACGNNNISSDAQNETLPQTDGSDEPAYRRVSAGDAYQMMQDTDEFILLDVRRDEEFREAHIEGAVLIPDYEIESRAAAELPDKDALILVYCRSGRRSADAANKLVGMGYTNVYDFGGIIDWPYDTVRG